MRAAVADPNSLLHALDKHHGIEGHECSKTEKKQTNVPFGEALKMPKFWALVSRRRHPAPSTPPPPTAHCPLLLTASLSSTAAPHAPLGCSHR